MTAPAGVPPVITENQDNAGLRRRTAASAFWMIATRLATKAIEFIVLLVLARMLSPADFGIIVIAMTSVTIIEAVFEIPIYQVLIAQDELNRSHLDTAFTLGFLRGVAMSLVLLAIAVPFAHIYNDPRLLGLIAILSLAPGLRGLASPRLVVFAKQLNYRRELTAEFISKLAAMIVTTIAAWQFHDYRALMTGVLATPAAWVVITYILAPYSPRLSLKEWPVFAHFMRWTTASQFLSAFNWQCDRLILGRTISPGELGAFSLANDLAFIPEQALVKPIVRPLVSAFAIIRSEPEKLASAYHTITNMLLAIGTPILVGLSVLAEPAVRFALGGKWIASIPILQWLSLTLIPPLLTAPFPSLALATGRPQAVLWQTAAEAMTKLPLMIIGVAFLQVEGAILARAVSAVVTAMMVLFFVRRILGTPVLYQLARIWRTIVGGVALAALLLYLRPALGHAEGPLLGVLLAGVGIIGLLFYGLTLTILWGFSGRPAGLERILFERIARPAGDKIRIFWQ
jgi:O-antigen/teichoic acid export membrane protein